MSRTFLSMRLFRRFAACGKISILIPIAYMILIYSLSSIPGNGNRIPSKIIAFIKPEIQNILHIPEYGILVFLWFYALLNFYETIPQSIRIAMLISVIYGVLDEVHQFFVPGRYMGLTDIALDLTGVMLMGFYLRHSGSYQQNKLQLPVRR